MLRDLRGWPTPAPILAAAAPLDFGVVTYMIVRRLHPPPPVPALRHRSQGEWLQPSHDHVCDDTKIEGGCCREDRCWGGPAAQVTQHPDAGWSDCQAGRRIPLPVGESELAAGNYDAMPEAGFHLLNELAAPLRPVPDK